MVGPSRSAVLAVLCATAACGGSSPSPTVPSTPAPPSPPPVATWSVQGVVTDAMSGAPVPGATLKLADRPEVSTDATGAWQFTGSGTIQTSQSLTIDAAGYFTRSTGMRWDTPGRTNVAFSLIPNRSPFSLSLYRDLVRNAFDAPQQSEPLRRWTTNPNFYINTFNPKTGGPLEPAELQMVMNAIRGAVPQATGGTLTVGTIESGATARAMATGWINVEFTYEPTADYCGLALVGRNPGRITINYDACARSCGSAKVTPEAVVHEVGHAMGFWHTRADGIMNPFVKRCTVTTFTAEEQLHMRIAYQRPPGNLDVDQDPSTFFAEYAETEVRPVICRR